MYGYGVNMIKNEASERLLSIKKKIEEEFPNEDSYEKSVRLLDALKENEDLECINIFSRMLFQTAEKHGNDKMIEFAKVIKKLTARAVGQLDQEYRKGW